MTILNDRVLTSGEMMTFQVLSEEIKDRDEKIERQQRQLTIFQEQLKQQQTAIDNLRKLVCQINAEVCGENK